MNKRFSFKEKLWLYIGINAFWVILCFGVLLSTLLYKDVPYMAQHLFSDLHSYKIYAHTAITITYIIFGAVYNLYIYLMTKDNTNEEQSKE